MRLLEKLASKEITAEEIATLVIADPSLLSQLFEGLSIQKAPVKFGCEKTLRIISEKSPQILYPHYEFFVTMLDNQNSFLRWGTIYVLGNLAIVDNENKFEAVFNKYFSPISGSKLIPAANAIGGAAKIALAKPHLAQRITEELLKVEKTSYQSPECRNVALGQAIDSFDVFFDKIDDKKAVLAMIQRQLANTRNTTRRRAERFLKKHKK